LLVSLFEGLNLLKGVGDVQVFLFYEFLELLGKFGGKDLSWLLLLSLLLLLLLLNDRL
jgi:hypothetical protein